MTPIYHNSSAVQRMCGIISGAKKNGHICDLLTLRAKADDYAYDCSNDEFVRKYIGNYYEIEKFVGYDKLREKKYTERNNKASCYIKKIIKRLLRTLFSAFNVYDAQGINTKGILKLDIDYKSYERIVSISDPKSSHKLVKELVISGKIKDIEEKWIQYWGDPWITDIMSPSCRFKGLIKREEQKLLSYARKVIYTTPFTMEEQKRLYPKFAYKMFYVNQTADFNIGKNKNANNLVTLGYYGDYGTKFRNIIPLYKCCEREKFIINIAGKSDLTLLSTEFIKIYNRLPLQKVKAMEEESSILLCICNKRGNQIPGKIFYQAAYQKPIIVIVDGERNKEIKEYLGSFNRYILCENNEGDIKRAIMEAKDEIKENKEYILDNRFKDVYCAKMLLEN